MNDHNKTLETVFQVQAEDFDFTEILEQILVALLDQKDKNEVSISLDPDLWLKVGSALLKYNEYRILYEGLNAAVQETRKLLLAAQKAYEEDGLRQDERARRVLKILGFTQGGKRKARINNQLLHQEYLQLRSGIIASDLNTWKEPKPTTRTEAIDILAQRYNMTSEAVAQHIKLAKIELRRRR